MKKLLIIALFALLAFGGCSGDTPVNSVDLDDFIGDWFMQSTMLLNLDGRNYTESLGRTIYIRENGSVQDELGTTYNARFENLTLTLTRDGMFTGHDPYCGFYEGGTMLTFEFPAINPFFNQVYEGTVGAQTAVYTQYCNYKPMVVSGTVLMERIK